MGRRAAGLLLDMIEADDGAERHGDIVLEPTLIVRDSTALPPGA
jgi:DNA-binding LacI/PurR family transcriptional regulator